MKRKFIAGMMLTTMVFNLAACGSDKDTASTNDVLDTEESEAGEIDTEDDTEILYEEETDAEELDEESETEEQSSIEEALEMSDDDLLWYNENDWSEVCVTKVNGSAKYEGEFILPYPIEKIYSSAFSDATSLERVVLSDSMVYIGDCAFKNCTNLKRINLPSSIETIEPSAFQDCPNLVAYVDEGSYA